MFFNFAARGDSSDEEAGVDLSAWQSGAQPKRASPPRRASSGFQAMNSQPTEDVAMESEPEIEPEAEPAIVPAVAQMQAPAEPMLISSDKVSDEEDEDEEEEVAPVVGQDQVLGAEEEEYEENDDAFEDAMEVAPQVLGEDQDSNEPDEQGEEELVVPKMTIRVSIPLDELKEEDDAEIEDFTAGGDVVSRVLSEQQDKDGLMTYSVEFVDQHVEDVSQYM